MQTVMNNNSASGKTPYELSDPDDFEIPTTPSDITKNAKLLAMSKELDALYKETEYLQQLSQDQPKSLASKIGGFLMKTVYFLIKHFGVILLVMAVYYGGAGISVAGIKAGTKVMTTQYENFVDNQITSVSVKAATYVIKKITPAISWFCLQYIVGYAEDSSYTFVYYPCFVVVYAFMSINQGFKNSVKRLCRLRYHKTIPDTLTPPSEKATPLPTTMRHAASKKALAMATVFQATLGFYCRPNVKDKLLHLAVWGWKGYGWFRNWGKSTVASQSSQATNDWSFSFEEDQSTAKRTTPRKATPRKATPRKATPRKPHSPGRPTPRQQNLLTAPPPDVPNASKAYISAFPDYRPVPYAKPQSGGSLQSMEAGLRKLRTQARMVMRGRV